MFKIMLRFSCLLLTALLFLPLTGSAQTVTWPINNQVVEPDKQWKISFSQPVDASTVNEGTLYVIGADGKKVGVHTSVSLSNPRLIIVNPPNGGYERGQSYSLYINQTIHSYAKKESLQNTVEMKFSITTEDDAYSRLVQGTWDTSYSGFSMKATFKNDFTSDVSVPGLLNSKGTYSIGNSKMTMTILGRTVTGVITKVSDREFFITSASGNKMHFKKQ